MARQSVVAFAEVLKTGELTEWAKAVDNYFAQDGVQDWLDRCTRCAHPTESRTDEEFAESEQVDISQMKTFLNIFGDLPTVIYDFEDLQAKEVTLGYMVERNVCVALASLKHRGDSAPPRSWQAQVTNVIVQAALFHGRHRDMPIPELLLDIRKKVENAGS
jgi:hypothetical protein